MDSIYSRKRLKLPKIVGFGTNNRNTNNNKLIKVMAIFVIAFITIRLSIDGLSPMFNTICLEKTKEISTNIINVESSKILKDVNYEDYVSIEKDSLGNIKLLKLNTVKINMIASDIAYNIQQELTKSENCFIRIPLGSITGMKYISGFGPKINIQIYPVGSVITNFKSEFNKAGINQTIHRLYLDVTCKVTIITPYEQISSDILNQVLMTEMVIVGDVPEAYYNLEGMENDNVLDAIQ